MEYFMKRFMFVISMALVITACTGQISSPVPTLTMPMETKMPTTIPTRMIQETETAAPEIAVTDTPEPEIDVTDAIPSGEILLKIVPEESTVFYEVGETFLNQNNRFATAIGKTSQVNGEIYANPENPLKSRLGAFAIDISTFESDSTRRDNAIRRDWLESSTYPLATFVPRSITNLPDTYVPGEPYTFEVQGELTVKQTTLGVTFVVTAQYEQEQLTGSAETEILMSDFKIGPISIGGVLNTEDTVKIRFDFVARP
jgi:polyisoprenoid-binding protein YceI